MGCQLDVLVTTFVSAAASLKHRVSVVRRKRIEDIKESPGPQGRRVAPWRRPGWGDPRRHSSKNAESAGKLRWRHGNLSSPRTASRDDSETGSCKATSVVRIPAPSDNRQSRCYDPP